MSKQLPTDGITNELAGSSVFFSQPARAKPSSKQAKAPLNKPPTAKVSNAAMRATMPSPQEDTATPTNHGTMQPRYRDTTVSRNHDTTPPTEHVTSVAELAASDIGLFEEVRRATRQYGKEAATHRFTSAEKRAIADIVYTYDCQGLKTSENEITRIAVNWLLLDYQRHGMLSVLAQLLDSLHG